MADDAAIWEAYRTLLARADQDAAQDLLEQRGVDILRAGLPYLLVAVRNAVRSRERRGSGRFELPTDVDLDRRSGPVWDPLERVIASQQLDAVVVAMAELAAVDAHIIWRTVEGMPDNELLVELERLDLPDRPTSQEALRKRRSRARARLRAAVADGD